jgi:hypothetical protein
MKPRFAIVLSATAVLGGIALAAPDKYTVRVQGGLGFSEFKGYESWEVVATSSNEKLVAVIVANPTMISAYKAGIPADGRPFPNGSKMAKVHWIPAKNEHFPNTTVPGALHDVDFMVKDTKRFADSEGWGWAMFKYTNGEYTPGTLDDQPPQGKDAKCGLSCHTTVKSRDYVFTSYGKR